MLMAHRSWRLYSCRRFTCTSITVFGSRAKLSLRRAKSGKAELVPVFYLVHAAQNLAVGDEGVELFELLRMGEVPVAAEKLGYKAVQPRIYLAEPAAVVNAVGDVGEDAPAGSRTRRGRGRA